jgi:hypothetical protein
VCIQLESSRKLLITSLMMLVQLHFSSVTERMTTNEYNTRARSCHDLFKTPSRRFPRAYGPEVSVRIAGLRAEI